MGPWQPSLHPGPLPLLPPQGGNVGPQQPPYPGQPPLGQWQPPLPPGPLPPLPPHGANVGPQQQAPYLGQLPVPPPPLGGQPAAPQGQAQAVPPGLWPPQAGQPLPPALQQLLAVLGVPAAAVAAIPVAQAPSGAQAAPAALGVGGEVRGLRGMQHPNKAIRRIHDKIDGKATGPIYKRTSQGNCPCITTQSSFRKRLPRC